MSITINKSGFSVLEIVVVMGIISVGLLGVTSLVIQNLQVQNIDKNYLTASMLAQEGLELVRNYRDKNWLTGGARWHDGIIEDLNYTIDYYEGRDISINGSVDDIDDAGAVLQIDQYGSYAHNISGGATTSFFRIINVVDPNIDNDGDGDTDYIIASSTVRFKERGRTHDYVAETYFYDWRY